MAALFGDVCYALKIGQTQKRSVCPLSANSRLMHRSKQHPYSITSSARAITLGGTVTPKVLAVFRLMINSNLVG